MKIILAFLCAASVTCFADEPSQEQKEKLASLQLELIKKSHSLLATVKAEMNNNDQDE